MYYVVETKYVGPNQDQDQYVDADHIDITTTPAAGNMSGEECLEGWCGTTDDWAVFAHGAYKTLEEARQAVEKKFAPCREDDDLEQYAEYEGVVARFRLGEYAPMSKNMAADWLYSGMEQDIAAETSDQRLAELVEEYETEANYQGSTLQGTDPMEILREYRQRLRDELDE